MALAGNGYGLLPVVEVAHQVLAAFDCGKPHLNAFLQESAQLHRERLGLTTVVFHRDVPERVVGYFTLSNDALPLTTSEVGELGLQDSVQLSAYPAVKLGRLAVTSDLQGCGVGKQVIGLVHGEILDSTSLSAARLVIVDADNEQRVVQFYERMGYRRSLWAERKAQTSGPRKAVTQQTVKMARDILAP
ncbi:GNAT family N-acetyltransferase [Rubrivivax gelatinosus]|uniref:N-acetyltransferase domain-containing protein n=1 Tax=Rubrivivax gelatinosus TaxID=28068 RepID=A0ABS1DZ34_RUBGE|nr:GNAT family N-acetyltransferase [Rubrivivax gelatinosus]MBK1714634.1 hypothetical protein [Rubrivivax gelatinosus]